MCGIVIYGNGKTGQGCRQLLRKQGKDCAIYDDARGFDKPCRFTANTTVIVSPGVKPDAKGLMEAKNSGAKIVGELSYCFPFCKGKCISVTGTNGKTTTCQLIYHILQYVEKKSRLLGNGGIPFSSQVLDCTSDEIVVLESSSFQLTYCDNFAPYVSVFTNIASDHLDYHGSFDNYVLAKQNNFIYQPKDAYAVFNADDKMLMKIAESCGCQRLFYSTVDSLANCYFDGNDVVLKLDNKLQKLSGNYLKTLFKHNLSNCLAAILVCSILGVELTDCLNAISSYRFLPHRLQTVATVGNVVFVDDSKGTNVHATVSAVGCFDQNLALILGGSNKGYEFDDIFTSFKGNVKYICASGQTARLIATCGKKHGYNVDVFENIGQCVYQSYFALKDIGGVVLMSNACASFDKFSSYEERGDYFQRVVNELKTKFQV